MKIINVTRLVEVTTYGNFIRKKLPGKAKWIAALKSGKYKQTQRCLWNKKTNGYCCLGVLSKIQGRLTVEGYDKCINTESLSNDNPVTNVIGPLGKVPYGATVNFKGKNMENLADLNDARIPFKTITKVINILWK